MGIANWFLNKNFTQNERYAINLSLIAEEFVVKKETEKAKLIAFKSDYGTITSWIPKSVLC